MLPRRSVCRASRAPKVLPASCAPLRSRRVAPGGQPSRLPMPMPTLCSSWVLERSVNTLAMPSQVSRRLASTRFAGAAIARRGRAAARRRGVDGSSPRSPWPTGARQIGVALGCVREQRGQRAPCPVIPRVPRWRHGTSRHPPRRRRPASRPRPPSPATAQHSTDRAEPIAAKSRAGRRLPALAAQGHGRRGRPRRRPAGSVVVCAIRISAERSASAAWIWASAGPQGTPSRAGLVRSRTAEPGHRRCAARPPRALVGSGVHRQRGSLRRCRMLEPARSRPSSAADALPSTPSAAALTQMPPQTCTSSVAMRGLDRAGPRPVRSLAR